MKIRPPEISAQSHEVIKAVAAKHGWTFADALDHVCAFYDDKLWHEAATVARAGADVDKRRARLAGKVSDDE